MNMDKLARNTVLQLLTRLREQGDTFNRMGGSLYSSVIADEMNETYDQIRSYGVEVKFLQPCDGRVEWINLDELIEEYSA